MSQGSSAGLRCAMRSMLNALQIFWAHGVYVLLKGVACCLNLAQCSWFSSWYGSGIGNCPWNACGALRACVVTQCARLHCSLELNSSQLPLKCAKDVLLQNQWSSCASSFMLPPQYQRVDRFACRAWHASASQHCSWSLAGQLASLATLVKRFWCMSVPA
jgi:hypothetical protein